MLTGLDLTSAEGTYRDDTEVLERFQTILLQAAEGARDSVLDAEYWELRRRLMRSGTYRDIVPPFVRQNSTLETAWPSFKAVSPQWAPRRAIVREQLAPVFERAEVAIGTGPQSRGGFDSAHWTGIDSGETRFRKVRQMLPVAIAAIDQLITTLETPRGNGGPPLDERREAVEQLRALHSTLGDILAAAEAGELDGAVGQGLMVDASRYAKRAARALKYDPMPYATSALLLGLLTACGFPGIGAFMSTVALTVTKNSNR